MVGPEVRQLGTEGPDLTLSFEAVTSNGSMEARTNNSDLKASRPWAHILSDTFHTPAPNHSSSYPETMGRLTSWSRQPREPPGAPPAPPGALRCSTEADGAVCRDPSDLGLPVEKKTRGIKCTGDQEKSGADQTAKIGHTLN